MARTLPEFCVVLCIVYIVLFYKLFVCKCALYYWYWVSTQLQLTNISYHQDIFSHSCMFAIAHLSCELLISKSSLISLYVLLTFSSLRSVIARLMWRGRHVTCVRKGLSISKKTTRTAAPSVSAPAGPHAAPAHSCTGPR